MSEVSIEMPKCFGHNEDFNFLDVRCMRFSKTVCLHT